MIDTYTDTERRIARVCHEANRAYCIGLGDNSQLPWDDAPKWQKNSVLAGVRYRIINPLADNAEMHQQWLIQKAAEGWKYGPVKDAEKKEHPCYVPYEQLPHEQQTKDSLFSAIVSTLMPF
jgi:hypothetical protein